jgi:hypothetical protein
MEGASTCDFGGGGDVSSRRSTGEHRTERLRSVACLGVTRVVASKTNAAGAAQFYVAS